MTSWYNKNILSFLLVDSSESKFDKEGRKYNSQCRQVTAPAKGLITTTVRSKKGALSHIRPPRPSQSFCWACRFLPEVFCEFQVQVHRPCRHFKFVEVGPSESAFGEPFIKLSGLPSSFLPRWPGCSSDHHDDRDPSRSFQWSRTIPRTQWRWCGDSSQWPHTTRSLSVRFSESIGRAWVVQPESRLATVTVTESRCCPLRLPVCQSSQRKRSGSAGRLAPWHWQPVAMAGLALDITAWQPELEVTSLLWTNMKRRRMFVSVTRVDGKLSRQPSPAWGQARHWQGWREFKLWHWQCSARRGPRGAAIWQRDLDRVVQIATMPTSVSQPTLAQCPVSKSKINYLQILVHKSSQIITLANSIVIVWNYLLVIVYFWKIVVNIFFIPNFFLKICCLLDYLLMIAQSLHWLVVPWLFEDYP